MGGKNSYESTRRYQEKVYDRVGLVLPKGMKETIKQAADAQNKSLNAFIVDLLKEQLGLDQA